METITLTGRSSKLSIIQIELVKAKIESTCPGIEVRIQTSNSLGDRLQHIPLQTVEGTDFFTEEVFKNLYSGEADIAVHSLKDMSAAHFFGGNHFAVVDRDEVRDIAIFNPSIVEKLQSGSSIIIGTCSPRRELMATGFLKATLPQLNSNIHIQTKFIRGNVDTRLQKLDEGNYDGIILAAAGLNRLLSRNEYSQSIKLILKNKKMVVLPLLECTPAPCQGAIVAEALPTNKKAIKILEQINNEDLFDQCIKEKKTALKYGVGCDQKFGVTTISYGNHKSIFAAGENEKNHIFEEWHQLPALDIKKENIWDGSVYNKSPEGEIIDQSVEFETSIVFVSNHKAVREKFVPILKNKSVWAAGTKTWKKLASQGIWVEGCSDGLGLESLQKIWNSPLFNIKQNQVTILTNERSAKNWNNKNWKAIGTYRTKSKTTLSPELKSADLVFWSSSFQYHQHKTQVKADVIHACASGETSKQLIKAGINPILFPTIQSFQQWKTQAIRSATAG